ncbi:hypothetical protein ACQ4WX_33220 [Streptomyces lasalocidi]
MDERSDAAEPPTATLAHDRAQARSPHRPPQQPAAQAQCPQAAHAPSAAGPARPGSGADREAPVTAPLTVTTTFEDAVRAPHPQEVPPPRRPTAAARARA